MKILVVHYSPLQNDRKTIDEHLYSFKRYSGAQCFYLNVYFGVPFTINKIDFDLVVYHYTFLGQKWSGVEHFRKVLKICEPLKTVSGYKIALPQDEYVNSEALCQFLKDFKVDKLYTCFYEKDWDRVYPKSLTGLKSIETTLTGYVDENSLQQFNELKPHNERKYDIGYRARKVPYWLGEHGTIKWRITEAFQEMIPFYPHLKMNISNSEKDVFIGNKWHEFLSDCRVVLGCEGGASLHDPRGEIRKKVDEFVAKYPSAPFEEVKEKCFPNEDNNIELFAISPRHFDACITKTCQVLIEGNYDGIFQPNKHYIPIKKDFSNIKDVLKKIEDVSYCEEIAQNAYTDIILNGDYTYARFVKKVLQEASEYQGIKPIAKSNLAWNLTSFIYFFVKVTGIIEKAFIYAVRRSAWRLLKHTGLLPYFKSIMSKKLA